MSSKRQTKVHMSRRAAALAASSLFVLSVAGGAHAMPSGSGHPPGNEPSMYVPLGAESNMDALRARVEGYANPRTYVPTGAPENVDALRARVVQYSDAGTYVPTGAPENVDALRARVAQSGIDVRNTHSNVARVHVPSREIIASGSPVVERRNAQEWIVGVAAAALLVLAIAMMVARSRRASLAV